MGNPLIFFYMNRGFIHIFIGNLTKLQNLSFCDVELQGRNADLWCFEYSMSTIKGF